MYMIKSLSGQDDVVVVDAISLVNRIEIAYGAINFLLQSYDIKAEELPMNPAEPQVPFRAAQYHCDYRSDGTDPYKQCFDYLLTLEEFAGAQVIEG